MNAPVSPTLDPHADLRTEYSACPLCENRKLSRVGAAGVTGYVNWHDRLPATLEWMRCDDCSHVFTRHHWTDAGLAEVFRKSHAGQVAGGDPDMKRQAWKPVVQNAVSMLGGYEAVIADAGRIWLDVGCGDGALVMTASEFGFRAMGLDARQDAVDALRTLGYQAACGNFMSANADKPVNVISMCDLLEHLPFPLPALRQAHRMLAADGILIISLPNMDSSSWRVMDAHAVNPYWMEIEHHHNFTRGRLSQVLAEAGFRCERFDIPARYKSQMELYARKIV
jgi:protein O-GlcNAc transferase